MWWVVGKSFCVFTSKIPNFLHVVVLWGARMQKSEVGKVAQNTASDFNHYPIVTLGLCLISINDKANKCKATKQIWQPLSKYIIICGPSNTPRGSALTPPAEPSADPASPLSVSPHRALQLLAQEGPPQLPAHKRQSESARICKLLW